MNRKRTSRLAHVAAVFAVLVACTAANGQPGPDQGPGGRGMMRGGGLGGMCGPRAGAIAGLRIERIERVVRPTEAQRAGLEELRNASTKAAEIIKAACPKEPPAKATERLQLMEKRYEAMLQAIKMVRPAFENFYASLDDQQKARLDAGPRQGGRRGEREGPRER